MNEFEKAFQAPSPEPAPLPVENQNIEARSDSGVTMEKRKEQAQAEEKLRAEAAAFFVENPDDRVTIEVFDPLSEEPAFLVRKTVTPTEQEREFLPEGATLDIELLAMQEKTKEGATRWNVSGAALSIGDKLVTLEDILPKGSSLKLDSNSTPHYHMGTKDVSLNRLSTFTDVTTLLHEAGHGHDYIKQPREKNEVPAHSLDKWEHELWLLPKTERERVIQLAQTRERNAWANGFHLARKNELPIQKLIRPRSQEALATYDLGVSDLLIRGSAPEYFASSEQRREMRSVDKQIEAGELTIVGFEANKITDLIEDRVEQPLDSLIPEKEGKKENFGFAFTDKETGRIYSVEVSGKNNVVITESQFGQDGSLTQRTMSIAGTRLAWVLVQNTERTEPTPDNPFGLRSQNTFSGRLGVLKKDEFSVNHEQSFEIMRAVFQNLKSESAQEAMSVAAFRRVYSDAPEPYNFDGWTGRPLSVDEKIEFLKNESVQYQNRASKNKS